MTDTSNKRAKTSIVIECRACLAKIYDDSCVDLFRAWDPPWSGMGISIAEDLAKLANIQICVSDSYSRNICKECCSRLQDAIKFTWSVQNNDVVLRKRHKDCIKTPTWPKPIQVDKNIASTTLNEMNVEVKQEVLSEDEDDMNETYSEHSEPRLDIKIEPEEITPAPIPVEVNSPFLLAQVAEERPKVNGATEYLDECLLQDVKVEPMSDDETETVPGLPKDCMLCMKTFNTVKGLKAHVIAVHSYNTVTTPRVDKTNVCTTCSKSFATRTDLFVHETSHSKFACFVCDEKFDTFPLLTKHRNKRCMKTSVLPRLKTLKDVRRPVPVCYIMDKTAQPTNSLPRSEVPEQLQSESNSITGDNVQQQQESLSADGKTPGVPAEELIPKWNEISEKKIQPHEPEKPSEEKRSETTSAIEETNTSLKELGSNMDKLSDKNIQGPHETIQMTFVNEEAFGSTTEGNAQKQESIDMIEDIVDSEGSKKAEIIIEQVKNSFDTSRINEKTAGSENNNEPEENKSEVTDRPKENVSGACNTTGENITEVNKIDKPKVDHKPEEKRIEVINETSVNVTENKRSELSNETKENVSKDDKIEEKRTEVINETTVNVTENKINVIIDDKIEEQISEVSDELEENVQAITSFESDCTNKDNVESKQNKTIKNIEQNSLETSANENKSTTREQIVNNEQVDEQNLENCLRLPKQQLKKFKALSNPSEESMEIQLEIHSMDKEDNAMDIDNDLESEIKMGSSDSDKTQ